VDHLLAVSLEESSSFSSIKKKKHYSTSFLASAIPLLIVHSL